MESSTALATPPQAGSSSSSKAKTTTTAMTVSKVPGRTNMPDEAASNPHYVVKRGVVKGFKNPYPSFSNSVGFVSLFRNVVWPLLTGRLKRPDTRPPTVPVVKPEWLPGRRRDGPGKLRATWLGHACYHVEFPSGLRVLFDPVFEDRCSPLAFMGPKRYTPRPCDLADIPVVDAVVISHSHYDHLSHASVLEIQRRHPRVHFFVGLGLEKWFRACGLNNVTELDWWEDVDLTLRLGDEEEHDEGQQPQEGEAAAGGRRREAISARISCLPCQHTSGRSVLDRDATLWCSWAVRSGDKSVWFGGDTGYRSVPRILAPLAGATDDNRPVAADDSDYGPAHEALPRCPQFQQIGELRGPFDLGLIPIGAYRPRAAFSAVHADPHDAVDLFRDTRCAAALAMHWGTWALTLEDVLEPPRRLREALARRGIPETGVFDVCDIGESREF
ncbi:beta-lactamase superfamily protein [Hirsutella rhossiliensis]|uniref:Beta-lactamase superfamily domain-containing protein n=1 Tax=Hirsutella rhossiliensis TaxID=111463 RepID=A0A9P8MNZ4_9HYPO|nr:beta-lactamase superfamily domain-containing protein [Hirsutella rhossiliensis]KAH0958615.1 beta-lactamase superfamily domain-containing protein [Hirsutella rhossiliensis]